MKADKIKLLRDLPGCPAGRIFKRNVNGHYFHQMTEEEFMSDEVWSYSFSKDQVEQSSDWFAEVDANDPQATDRHFTGLYDSYMNPIYDGDLIEWEYKATGWYDKAPYGGRMFMQGVGADYEIAHLHRYQQVLYHTDRDQAGYFLDRPSGISQTFIEEEPVCKVIGPPAKNRLRTPNADLSFEDYQLLRYYQIGFHYELDKRETPFVPYPYTDAFNLGRIDAVAGDDVSSVDMQSSKEILEQIKD